MFCSECNHPGTQPEVWHGPSSQSLNQLATITPSPTKSVVVLACWGQMDKSDCRDAATTLNPRFVCLLGALPKIVPNQ
jgi:hypothetical protein